ncbi:MAG: acetate kinase, partial [Synergistes sp.]|nr:acetate kinase [Synergistes sp.]
SVMLALGEHTGGDVQKVSDIVHKKSGLLGISGISSDLRDVEEAANNGDKRAKLAEDILVTGVKKYIAGYAAEMGGVDVVVFTAGIGENGIGFRKKVCDDMEFMGIKIDAEKNNCRGKDAIISTPDSRVTVMVVPTDEEMAIARDTKRCVEEAK